MTKNIRYILLALILGVFSSCSKEEIGMTSTVDLAGEWMVTVDVADASGNILEQNYLGAPIMMITYNTNADDGKEVYVSDLGAYFGITVPVPCNVGDRSFGASAPVANEYPKMTNDITVTGGKVTYNGTVSPSNMPVDAIVFDFVMSDSPYVWKCRGYRRTGLNGGAE